MYKLISRKPVLANTWPHPDLWNNRGANANSWNRNRARSYIYWMGPRINIGSKINTCTYTDACKYSMPTDGPTVLYICVHMCSYWFIYIGRGKLYKYTGSGVSRKQDGWSRGKVAGSAARRRFNPARASLQQPPAIYHCIAFCIAFAIKNRHTPR